MLVTHVTHLQDYKLLLEFSDGSKRMADLGLSLVGASYASLRLEGAFQKVAVDHRRGTIVWPNGITIDPAWLYMNSLPVGATGLNFSNSTPQTVLAFDEDPISMNDLIAFVGKNQAVYLKKFTKSIDRDGFINFAFTWNWAAFFLGPIWAMYRRLYLFALLLLVLPGLPGALLGAMMGDNLYLQRAAKMVAVAKEETPDMSESDLAKLGGVNYAAIPIALTLTGSVAALLIWLYGIM